MFILHHEITAVLRVAIRCVQKHAFLREYKQLSKGRSVDGGSRILPLTPFMYEHEIIRVGGRIHNAALPYDARHPVLLPKSHRLTILIIQREHVRNLHSGLQATMHAVRRRFWPLAARSIVQTIIHSCVTCFKYRPAASLMADLPIQRVTASRPFTHSGVDYAGPMFLKDGRRRNAKLHKTYISSFMRDNEVEWRFIPPHAPHVEGLWEAAVKSAKFHINRMLGNANLTYKEMQTVLCEIEAVLNSRPLTPLSKDPNNLHCITPGHFLIGAALNSFPVADLTEENPSQLLRWQRKWRTSKGQQLKVGQLAIVQQPGLGPLQWLLGWVQQLHSGPDGIARTATLRTAKGQITRPLTILAILPRKVLLKINECCRKLMVIMLHRFQHASTGFDAIKGDFNTEDKECLSQPKKFEDEELEAFLEQDPSQTQNH
ncbi:uncharacterized protein LOC120359022 [Solenopsis invicta]|uniref:uncharacterized protein LOC120359022 n=1 Tax=Solenopsis invicta TaxID=13686 RepID=UPI00193E646D|nr:uncharacterized protein LOC120359022 [Solenopsis invicta]